jgi:hypothetical protein
MRFLLIRVPIIEVMYNTYISSFFRTFLCTERSFCLLFYVHNKPGHLFSTRQQRILSLRRGTEEKTSKEIVVVIKGSLTRDFRLQVFFANQYPIGAISNFYEKTSYLYFFSFIAGVVDNSD